MKTPYIYIKAIKCKLGKAAYQETGSELAT